MKDAANQDKQALVLLLACPDQQGVVARVAAFIHQHGGNIYSADQHYDRDAQQFFARFAWSQETQQEPQTDLGVLQADFGHLAKALAMRFWRIARAGRKLRTAIFVSGYAHCLYDLLVHRSELDCQFCCILSNHQKLQAAAAHFDLPFYHCDFALLGKEQAEQQQLQILQRQDIELVILARYMQILSPRFLAQNPAPTINIHHSFLPAFEGARPYHQAYQRGVKIIGATSHYVTEELDQGPIIAQGVQTVSHRDGVADLVRKGRGIEKQVLLQAVQAHSQHRVLPFANRNIVFPG